MTPVSFIIEKGLGIETNVSYLRPSFKTPVTYVAMRDIFIMLGGIDPSKKPGFPVSGRANAG